MRSIDWGEQAEALRLRVPDWRYAPTPADDAEALPAVRAARELGFEPAPEAPIWSFLPAIWPGRARAWIPDTRVRTALVSCEGEPTRSIPVSAADYFEMEADTNALLSECGFPPRPAGRLWLLRPPPGFDSLDAALNHLLASARADGLRIMADRAFVEHVRRGLDPLFASGS